MPRQNMSVEAKIGGRKGKVRKRGCSSSSSSSLPKNYRLKRTFLVGKRWGSTTPVPMWKMMSSESPSKENDKAFKDLAGKNGEKAKELSVSARKLASILWEINGLPSPRVKREILDDKISEVGTVIKERILQSSKLSSMDLGLSDPFHSPVSQRTDPAKLGSSHRKRASASSHKLLLADCDLWGATSYHNCLVQVDQTQNHAPSPYRHGLKNCLKDVYNSLTTSRELLKVLSRVWCLEQLNSTTLSLVSALKVELHRACTRVNKLIRGQKTKSEIDILLKQLEEEKVVRKIREQDRIHSAIKSLAGELEIEKKLRRQTNKLNEKLSRELVETKASLSRAKKEIENEKRAREIVEQVCDELARGIGEDKAEVEELKRESAKVREEVEKEREMFHLADVLREERVQMKLSEAKYLFEEKNALIEKLRNELEVYLKSKTGEKEQQDGSPSYEKLKELEKYLRETFPGCYPKQDKEKEDIEANNKEELDVEEDDDDDDDDDDDEDDSDLHSIELNMDDMTKSFRWGEAGKNGSKRNSFDKCRGRKSISEKTEKPKLADGTVWECNMNKQENLNLFESMGLFEFTSHSSKKDVEEEMERYNMIKDLRDHIVSGSRLTSSQDLASLSRENLGQPSISSNGPDGVVFQG